MEKIVKFDNFNEEKSELTAHDIVINCLTMYNLADVESKGFKNDLANEIVNDLVNAGLMK
jgi:hypothetical protein